MPKPTPRKRKIIGIVGSRRRHSVKDALLICRAFEAIFRPGDRIVSGGCPKGGDYVAEQLARKLGLTIIIHHADWNIEGKTAGFLRNTDIANDCDVLIAAPAPDRKGGTEDTIRKVKALGKKIILV